MTFAAMGVVTSHLPRMHTRQNAWRTISRLSATRSISPGPSYLAGKRDIVDTCSWMKKLHTDGNRSFGGTISTDICEHLGTEYLSGIILTGGVPYGAAFMEVGTPQIGSTFRTLASPDIRATELAGAIVHLVDSCVADGFDVPIETKWLWRGVAVSQVCSA